MRTLLESAGAPGDGADRRIEDSGRAARRGLGRRSTTNGEANPWTIAESERRLGSGGVRSRIVSGGSHEERDTGCHLGGGSWGQHRVGWQESGLRAARLGHAAAGADRRRTDGSDRLPVAGVDVGAGRAAVAVAERGGGAAELVVPAWAAGAQVGIAYRALSRWANVGARAYANRPRAAGRAWPGSAAGVPGDRLVRRRMRGAVAAVVPQPRGSDPAGAGRAAHHARVGGVDRRTRCCGAADRPVR